MRQLNYLLLPFLLFLSACQRPQNPTPQDTITKSGSNFRPDFQRQFSDTLNSEEIHLPYADIPENSKLAELLKTGSYEAKNVYRSVHFNFDKSNITPDQESFLQETAQVLFQKPTAHVVIVGHCDWYGTSEYNLGLGERRAQSAAIYLETKCHVEGKRIYYLSRGDIDATRNLSKEAARKDRRSDLLVVCE